MQTLLRIARNILSVGLVSGACAVGYDNGVSRPGPDGAWAGDESGPQEEFVDGAGASVTPGDSVRELSERQVQINNVLDATPGDWSCNFEEVPITDVVAILRSELSRRGFGTININYNPPSRSSDGMGGDVPEPTVTIVLSGVTLRTLLVEICRNSGCVFNVTDSGIDIYAQNDTAFGIVETRVWCSVPPGFFPGVDPEGTRVDVTEFLMQLGLRLDVRGATAYYDPRLSELTVTGTSEDLDLMDRFVYAARFRSQQETE